MSIAADPSASHSKVPRIWGIDALLLATSDLLAARFGTVTVSGEISGLNQAASGHRYFSLKDADSGQGTLRCAMFRRSAASVTFPLRDGLKIQAVGRLTVYEPRGDLQFVVESMRPLGQGNLHEEFLRLKMRLAAEGLFDSSRKRPIPAHPHRIGVVSSLAGAALHDILTAIARRAPHIQVIVYPSLVQGAEAPLALVGALRQAASRSEVDALILARGGGSLEDLWAFNDERVVRAVVACPLPLVCGVGHETDFTLCDFAADLRAATPTAAAELLTPDRDRLLEDLVGIQNRLGQSMRRRLDRQAQSLDLLAMAVLRPAQSLSRRARQLQALASRLDAARLEWLHRQHQALDMRARRLQGAQERQRHQADRALQALSTRIHAQDPHQVLRRGYAWIADTSGRPVVGVSGVHPGQQVAAVWHDGRAWARIDRVDPGPTPKGGDHP